MSRHKHIEGRITFEDAPPGGDDLKSQFEEVYETLQARFKAPMRPAAIVPVPPRGDTEEEAERALPFPVVLTFQERAGKSRRQSQGIITLMFGHLLTGLGLLPGPIGTTAKIASLAWSLRKKDESDGVTSTTDLGGRLFDLIGKSPDQGWSVAKKVTQRLDARLVGELELDKLDRSKWEEFLEAINPSGKEPKLPAKQQAPAQPTDDGVQPPIISFETTQLLGWLTKDQNGFGFVLEGVTRFDDDAALYGPWARFDVLGPDGSQLLTDRLPADMLEDWLEDDGWNDAEMKARSTQELRAAFLKTTIEDKSKGRRTVKGRLWFSDGRTFGVRRLAIFAPPRFPRLLDECCPPADFLETSNSCTDDNEVPPVLMAPRALAVTATDEAGYFEFQYPDSVTLEAEYSLIRASGISVPLAVKLDKGGCEAGPEFPQPILIEIDHRYRSFDIEAETTDIAEDCGCQSLAMTERDRAVDEYSFDVVVRTSDPMITRTRLELETPTGQKPDVDGATKDAVEGARSLGDPEGSTSPINSLFRVPLTRSDPVVWDKTPIITQAATIAHGRVLTVKQVWRADGYSLGDLRYSLPLAPLQKKNIAVTDWGRTDNLSLESQQENVDSLANSMGRERSVSEIVNSAVNETLRGRSDSGGGGRSGGFGFSVGGFSLGASGGSSSAWSSSSQDSAKSLAASFVNQLRDKVVQSANSYRAQRVTTVQQISQSESTRAVSETVANRNACHAITVQYFEVLRHFRIDYELAAVRECLYIPMPVEPFDANKAWRWRDALDRHLPSQLLRGGLEAVERLQQSVYPGPEKTYADEKLQSLDGELDLSISINYPPGDIDTLNWQQFFGFQFPQADGLDQLFVNLRAKPPAEREDYFQIQIVPHIVRKIVEAMHLEVELEDATRVGINFRPLIVSNYRTGEPLRVALPEAENISAYQRRAIKALWVRIDVGPPTHARVELSNLLILATTRYTRSVLLGRGGTGSLVPLGSLNIAQPLRFPTPVLFEETRNPQAEDELARTRLVQHLNEHLEFYHKAIWWHMDAERRFSLLDGYVAPNGGGRSVASVVENRLVAIVGNCLVMPVAPGLRLDFYNDVSGKVAVTLDSRDSSDDYLLQLYKPDIPNPTVRISVPTRGVFAEAVMGTCNSCEAIDEARNWRYWEHPLPDEPTPIDPLSTASRAQPAANFTPSMAPSAVAQEKTNVGEAPSPIDLAKAIVAIASGSPFADARGLAGTQDSAKQALAGSYATTTRFGELATELNKQQQEIIGDVVKAVVSYYTGVPIVGGSSSSGSVGSGTKVKESINRDAALGRVAPEEAEAAIGRVNDAMISSLRSDQPKSPLEHPEVTSAIGSAVERGAPLSIQKGDTKVDIGEPATRSASTASRLPWPFRLFEPAVAEAAPSRPSVSTDDELFNKLWASLGTYRIDSEVYADQAFVRKERYGEPHMNMCATNMSIALHDAGAGKIFRGWKKNIVHDRGGRTIIASAEHLMELLTSRLGKPIQLSKADARAYPENPTLFQRRGILGFKDYWARPHQTSLTGDHIDIWNGEKISGGYALNQNKASIVFWPIDRLSRYLNQS